MDEYWIPTREQREVLIRAALLEIGHEAHMRGIQPLHIDDAILLAPKVADNLHREHDQLDDPELASFYATIFTNNEDGQLLLTLVVAELVVANDELPPLPPDLAEKILKRFEEGDIPED